MTNISKQQIHSKDYQIVYKQLTQLISKLTKNNASYLIDELLTDAEKIMIVKRYGAIFMYSQKYTPYRVSNTLGISITTASRLFEQYSQGKFDCLLNCLKKNETNQFLSLIHDLIVAQSSPRARARLLNRAQQQS